MTTWSAREHLAFWNYQCCPCSSRSWEARASFQRPYSSCFGWRVIREAGLGSRRFLCLWRRSSGQRSDWNWTEQCCFRLWDYGPKGISDPTCWTDACFSLIGNCILPKLNLLYHLIRPFGLWNWYASRRSNSTLRKDSPQMGLWSSRFSFGLRNHQR